MPRTKQNTADPAQLSVETQLSVEIINQRASDDLTRLQRDLSDMVAKIDAAHEELATIAPSCQAHTETLVYAQEQVATLESGLANANKYAKYAAGTADEQEAIKSIQAISRALASAKKALVDTEQTTSQAHEAATARKAELTAQLEQWAADKQSIIEELQLVAVARQRSHNDLGQQIYDGIMAEITPLQASIDGLRGQVVEGQTQLYGLVDEAHTKLTAWPEQREKLREVRPAEDPTSRTIAAAIMYLEAILRDRLGLKQDLYLESTKGAQPHWWEMLTVPQNEVYGNHQHLKANVSWLEDRLRKLKVLQEEYARTQL